MISNVMRNSIPGRLLSAVVLFLYDNFGKGNVARFTDFLETSWAGSFSQRVWYSFCSASPNMEGSKYARLMTWMRKGIFALGDMLQKSLFYKGMLTLRRGYEKITAGSVVFSQINRLSLRQWVLVAFAFYLPLEYIIRDRLSLPLISSVWEELFLAAAAFLILWRTALRQRESIARQTPLDGFLVLFAAVGLLLMSLVSPHPAVAVAGYRAVVEYMIWFFLMIRLIEDDRDFKVLYYAFVILAAGLSLHGIYQYIVAVPIPSTWVSQTEMGVRTRVFSLTGSPNIFGSLLVLLAPLAAGLVYYSEKAWQKLLFFGVTGMMCLCLLFTFSRGAWVGMVVAVLVFACYVDRRILALMGAAVAGVLVFVPSITSRLTYLFTSDYAEASAVGGRAVRWETGRLLLSENNPWLGFGLGRFGGAVAMNNKLLDETEEFQYFYMDNYYLKTMVEMGYLGIIVFAVLLAALLIWGLRAIWRSGIPAQNTPLLCASCDRDLKKGIKNDPLLRAVGDVKLLAVSIFSGICGVLVHCYFENIFEEPYMMAYFWGLAAALMYLGFFRKPYLEPNR